MTELVSRSLRATPQHWVALAVCAVLICAGLVTSSLSGFGSGGNSGSSTFAQRGFDSPVVAVGGVLPSGAECSRAVPRAGFEPRPENTRANRTTGVRVPAWTDPGYAAQLNEVVIPRIDGDYTGTTDEIIQWGACKWGVQPDVLRAIAIEESNWRQSMVGDFSGDDADCVPGATAPCPTSFGLLQVKHLFRPGSYPYSAQSTAFNVDYAVGVIRACYEGWVTYLADDGYRAGDLWGCIGWHFSGEWHDPLGEGYIKRVQAALAEKRWLEW